MIDDTRSLILDTIDDQVSDLLYYDRKVDEELPRGAIEEAIKSGVITVDDMVTRFAASLTFGLSE